jgi:hypothetical protein
MLKGVKHCTAYTHTHKKKKKKKKLHFSIQALVAFITLFSYEFWDTPLLRIIETP